jgi:histidinol dehydrogenase
MGGARDRGGGARAIPVLDWTVAGDRGRLEEILARYAATSWGQGEVAEQLDRFVDDLRARGDGAIVDYLRRHTRPDYTEAAIRVAPEELAAAGAALDPRVAAALQRAADNVHAYQAHIMPADPPPLRRHGAELGLRHTPVASAGLSVPGGAGAYPSTVIMLAVPAQVAGVGRLAVATPPRATGSEVEIDATVLGLCHLLGIDTVYRIGGFALAALALGTERVAPVEMIAGPSNIYGQQAKRKLFGTVGVDGLYGPSEIVVLADDSAQPAWVAADLLAQAEHDPGTAILVAVERAVIERVVAELDRLLAGRARRAVLERALAENCALVQVPDLPAAHALIDRIAPEHLTLAVADPRAALDEVRHAGAVFLGDRSPVASGDYWAGPSHCLPTGRTARFSSGCSVYTFLKRTSIEAYPNGLPPQAFDDIELLAGIEGFEAHAHSVHLRRPED